MHKHRKPLHAGIYRFFKGGIFFVMALLLLCGCSPHHEISVLCRQKISTPLVSMLQETTEGQKTIEVVITLNDTAGIRAEFPSLTIANPHVALGHLTIHEIFSLCSLNGVSYIDRPRISYPQ